MVVLLVRANTISKKERKVVEQNTGNSIRLTFHLYIHLIFFGMHAWFHLLLTAIDRRMNFRERERTRAFVRSIERFASLHRLTCFLLLLLLPIVRFSFYSDLSEHAHFLFILAITTIPINHNVFLPISNMSSYFFSVIWWTEKKGKARLSDNIYTPSVELIFKWLHTLI